MALADIAFASTVQVPIPGGKFHAVRGLNLMDIMGLVERHKAPITAAFAEMSGETDKALNAAGALGAGLLAALPEVAADVIAVASDEPESVGVVTKIPASIQLALLEKVAELTFSAEGGAGKVLEIVLNAVGGATNLLKGLKT